MISQKSIIRQSLALSLFVAICIFNGQRTMAQSPDGFSLGFADSIHSDILNEQRALLIYTPYAVNRAREKYPVLYVLDGENNFRSAAAIVERLINTGVCPPMIVVGIPNTNRGRDLTPSAVINNSDGVKDSGGGEKFISFIEMELMPYLESAYSASTYKLLMGHSLGGLMVIHSLVHHPDLFNAYISIDAALWWDGHRIINESKVDIPKNNYENKTLFLTIANRMEPGVDTTAVQADTSATTELIRYNLDFLHHVKQYPNNKLRLGYRYYPEDSHGTLSFISTYDALRFVFNYYAFPRYADFQTTNPQLVSLIANHYRKVSSHLGYEVLPPASLVNSLGYRALSLKQFKIAKLLFSLNVFNYPEDANLLDSYGDYHIAIGDVENAIIWYRKSLSITETVQTREKLNSLVR